jgi:hypothetical protein
MAAELAAAWVDCPITGCQNSIRIPIAVKLGPMAGEPGGALTLTATATPDLGPVWMHLDKRHGIEPPEELH